MGNRHYLWLTAAALLSLAPAIASAAAPARPIALDIAGGALDDALLQVAAASGHRIVFDPAIVRGRTVRPLKGPMLPEAAVRRLLEGTGLAVRTGPAGDWLVVRVLSEEQMQSNGKLLGTVRVAATVGSDGTGANGSGDPIATEGTGSYTTHATLVASKHPLALKDTPEAVSVVTRQQLDDRAIVDFDTEIDALPGVTATTGGFTSRGYAITNIQIDGGSPLAIGGNSNFTSRYNVVDDLSIYDSVSMQRGAAGTYTGVGSPGGVISLERKRPLDHAALEDEVQIGSWDNFRGTTDASSPVYFDGLLRARAVLTGQTNDYFYDSASRRYWQAYLNVEIRPTDTTTFNIGGKISYQRSTPFGGIPSGPDGSLLDVPRSTCLCTPWSYTSTKTREVFAQVTQKLGGTWKVHVSSSFNWQHSQADAFAFNLGQGDVGVTPGALDQGVLTVTRGPATSNQQVIDGFVDGSFAVAGIKFDVTAGGNYQHVSQITNVPTGIFYLSNYVVIPFDPNAFAPPAAGEPPDYGGQYNPRYRQNQYGLYGSVRISPFDWAHLTVSERYTRYDTASTTRYADGSPDLLSDIGFQNWSVPNVGLVVDLEKTVSAFANYQTIFDRNNYITVQGTLLPPITGRNIEGGVKAALAGGELNLSGSVFYIETTNTPVYDANNFIPQNPLTGANCCYIVDGSYQTSKGVELQAQGALTRRLKIDASYTYTAIGSKAGPDATAQGVTPPLRNTPEHLAKIWTAWKPPVLEDALTLGAGLHAETSVDPWTLTYAYADGQFVQSFIYTHRSGYIRGDLMAKFEVNEHLDLQVNINNVADRKYYNVVNNSGLSFYGEPRSFLFTMRGRL